MKRRSGGKCGFEPVDELFEARDVGVAERRLGHARGDLVGRIRELGAEREQIALELHERLVERRVAVRGARDAEPRVQLVDFSIRVHARVVFL